VLLARLERLDAMNERRRQIAAHYAAALAGTGARTQVPQDGAYHVYGYYTVLVDRREALREQLRDAGVATALYYAKPLHRHPHFARTCRFGALPVAEHAASCCLSLPIFPEMTDDEVSCVASALARLLA
jgi:dTDP-4-amino-4,6-dideoxygalactose transaminase